MRKAVIALALAGFLLTAFYLLETSRYPLGTAAEPGPGSYPLLVSAVLLLGFIGSGIEAVYSDPKRTVQWPKGAARWRVLVVAGSVFGYALFLPLLGHCISGSLLIFAVLQAMKKGSWIKSIFLSLCFGVGSFYLFAVLLDLPLPTGSIFD